jgi:hypothetical protein
MQKAVSSLLMFECAVDGQAADGFLHNQGLNFAASLLNRKKLEGVIPLDPKASLQSSIWPLARQTTASSSHVSLTVGYFFATCSSKTAGPKAAERLGKVLHGHPIQAAKPPPRFKRAPDEVVRHRSGTRVIGSGHTVGEMNIRRRNGLAPCAAERHDLHHTRTYPRST